MIDKGDWEIHLRLVSGASRRLKREDLTKVLPGYWITDLAQGSGNI